jgi:hypothetical protein
LLHRATGIPASRRAIRTTVPAGRGPLPECGRRFWCSLAHFTRVGSDVLSTSSSNCRRRYGRRPVGNARHRSLRDFLVVCPQHGARAAYLWLAAVAMVFPSGLRLTSRQRASHVARPRGMPAVRVPRSSLSPSPLRRGRSQLKAWSAGAATAPCREQWRESHGVGPEGRILLGRPLWLVCWGSRRGPCTGLRQLFRLWSDGSRARLAPHRRRRLASFAATPSPRRQSRFRRATVTTVARPGSS